MNLYKVSYLIDVVSDDPEDYTINQYIIASNEIRALKKAATNRAKDEATNSEIERYEGDLHGLMKFISEISFGLLCYTKVEELKKDYK